jgi:hypothetical protein
METYGDRVKRLATTCRTFEGIVTRWNIIKEPPPEEQRPMAEAEPGLVGLSPIFLRMTALTDDGVVCLSQ